MSVIFYCGLLCILLPSLVTCSFDHEISDRPIEKDMHLGQFINTNYSGYTLPTNLKPTLYNLCFLPFLNNGTFKGSTNITFDVINATNVIVMNMYGLTINDTVKPVVQLANRTIIITITNTTIDQEHQMVWFQLNDTLQPQKDVSIYIKCDGVLGSDMVGFYTSIYNTTDSNGVQTVHKMAITQFESTYARRAFPCFDEPAYRANFTVNIYRAKNQTSMSNMNISSSVYDKKLDMFLDTYKTSPAMPTYLVAFGVGDLAMKSDGGIVRVFAPQNIINYTDFALYLGKPILDTIGDFVNVTYPLEKMDVVAVPDFNAGAMENWGLTTYREKYVIYNPQKNTERDMFGVLSVLAHEFAHQWFGDLVTPLWWDYTWLNEAFATYFEYTVPNLLKPELKIGSSMYVSEAVQYALAMESCNTRPMTSPVHTPNQIASNFDCSTYDKGGSVLRMIELLLTTPVWRDGLCRYLTSNAYKTGTPEELFLALEAAANASNIPYATRVMATLTTWTTQAGYPLVTLHKDRDLMYFVTQSPYEINSTATWSIPLTYTTQEEGQFDMTKASQILLYTSSATISSNTTGWIVLNIEQGSYIRIKYDDDNMSKLKKQLISNHTAIGSVNRAQLIDDTFHLARSGHVNFSTALELCEYLPHETDYNPLVSYFTNMKFLINEFFNTSIGDGLMQYARDKMDSPFRTLTANVTNSLSTYMGAVTLQAVVQFSCDVRLPLCEQDASAAFNNWLKDPYSIPVESRQAVICTQLRLDSTEKSFQAVLDYFLNSDNGAEKLSFLNAMGCTSSEVAINRYLDVVCDVNANHVRLQDRWIAFRNLLSHQTGISTGLQYLTNNYNKVSQALGDRINSVFATLGNTISQDAHIAQVKSLANDTKVDQSLRDKLNSIVLPLVVKRQSWTQSQQASQLKTWVKNYVNASPSSIFGHSVFILVLSFLLTMCFNNSIDLKFI